MIEVTVICSDDERKMNQRFLISQEGLSLSHEDPELKRIVNEAIQNFRSEPLDIVLKIKYTW